MPQLCEADWRAVHGFLGEAEVIDGPEPFPRWVLGRLAALVGADFASFTELDRQQHRVLAYSDSGDDGEGSDELFWRIVDHHPLCRHQLETGEFAAVKLSDFGPPRARRNLEIWDEWFGAFGVVDELEAGIASSRRFTKNFIIDSTHRDFTERDREIIDVLRPHLAALYRRGVERHRAAALLGALESSSCVGVITVGEHGSVTAATEVARALVQAYLVQPLDGSLPPPLALWLQQRHKGLDALHAPRTDDAFVVEGERGRLTIRYTGTDLLVVEENVDEPRLLADGLGLTRREQEVLALVAEGRANAEIAAALWVTTSTVRKHLEHIYEKLNVNSRTAALARAFPTNAANGRRR